MVNQLTEPQTKTNKTLHIPDVKTLNQLSGGYLKNNLTTKHQCILLMFMLPITSPEALNISFLWAMRPS